MDSSRHNVAVHPPEIRRLVGLVVVGILLLPRSRHSELSIAQLFAEPVFVPTDELSRVHNLLRSTNFLSFGA